METNVSEDARRTSKAQDKAIAQELGEFMRHPPEDATVLLRKMLRRLAEGLPEATSGEILSSRVNQ